MTVTSTSNPAVNAELACVTPTPAAASSAPSPTTAPSTTPRRWVDAVPIPNLGASGPVAFAAADPSGNYQPLGVAASGLSPRLHGIHAPRSVACPGVLRRLADAPRRDAGHRAHHGGHRLDAGLEAAIDIRRRCLHPRRGDRGRHRSCPSAAPRSSWSLTAETSPWRQRRFRTASTSSRCRLGTIPCNSSIRPATRTRSTTTSQRSGNAGDATVGSCTAPGTAADAQLAPTPGPHRRHRGQHRRSRERPGRGVGVRIPIPNSPSFPGPVAFAQADVNGDYSLAGLDPGNYLIIFIDPDGRSPGA